MPTYATIDIGTNSALLLIGSPKNKDIEVIEDRTYITKLGEGLILNGLISDAASERTIQAALDFVALCKNHNVSKIEVAGTAVLRRAKNAQEFVEKFDNATGLTLDTVSAEREAYLTFLACTHDFGCDIVTVDIGGGSSELATKIKGQFKFASLDLGCVTLTNQFIKSIPETESDLLNLRNEIITALKIIDPSIFARPNDHTMVAVAGTPTTLAAMHMQMGTYDGMKVHRSTLKISDIRNIIDRLKPLTLDERRQIKGLMPERADVIMAGAEILQEIMSTLGHASTTISDKGIKWGLFYEKFCQS